MKCLISVVRIVARGRPPAGKPLQRERAQRAKDATFTNIPDTTGIHCAALPEIDGHTWHPMTVAWWDDFRASPIAATITPTDVRYLYDTALLHTQFWNGENRLAGEIRLRVAQFGATPADRERLRLRVLVPEEASGHVVSMTAERRARLKQLIKDEN